VVTSGAVRSVRVVPGRTTVTLIPQLPHAAPACAGAGHHRVEPGAPVAVTGHIELDEAGTPAWDDKP
jgi:hypothetical protein